MSLRDRVLLAAYPARLRRRHGAELITTLSELTQGRPSRSDRLRLVTDGLRERFRLPVRQPLGVVIAVLATLVGGAIGLAAGSWAGEQTYPSMPAVEAVARDILGPAARPDRLERERFALDVVERLGTPAGPADVQRRVGEMHTRLGETGWSVTPVERRGDDQWSFWAQSGGLRVSVAGYSGPESAVEAMGYPVRPATYLPLVLGGLLVGLLAGWLVGAALAYRLRGSVPAVVVAALGAVTLAVPAAKLYQGLIIFLGRDDGFGVGALVHDALAWMPWPLRDPTVFPDSLGPGLRALLAGSTLIALAVVIAPRPGAGSGVSQPARGE
ncbi:hypothetical protein [Actinoplanes auranticolor]|uniref:Uncharacterized protein n=1 Tax=Actinoplanes auranticolor TaxID=47988 RepID=A0A919S4U3_9ACTN|nr:hypothetical protein [Actinoplanes auranticolor]GIM64543.1 hypothetical protein Aau02nite_11090 [Actinoplanes auranticolor]